MTRVVLIAFLALGACGVDGEPVAPEPKPKPGLSISGRAEIGVARSW